MSEEDVYAILEMHLRKMGLSDATGGELHTNSFGLRSGLDDYIESIEVCIGNNRNKIFTNIEADGSNIKFITTDYEKQIHRLMYVDMSNPKFFSIMNKILKMGQTKEISFKEFDDYQAAAGTPDVF